MGWPNREKTIAPPESWVRGVADCKAPTTIAEQLHPQQGRVQAGPCQAPVGVVGRSISEAAVALAFPQWQAASPAKVASQPQLATLIEAHHSVGDA